MMRRELQELHGIMGEIESRLSEKDYLSFINFATLTMSSGFSVGTTLCDEGLALAVLIPEDRQPKIIFTEAPAGKKLEEFKFKDGRWVKSGDSLFVLQPVA